MKSWKSIHETISPFSLFLVSVKVVILVIVTLKPLLIRYDCIYMVTSNVNLATGFYATFEYILLLFLVVVVLIIESSSLPLVSSSHWVMTNGLNSNNLNWLVLHTNKLLPQIYYTHHLLVYNIYVLNQSLFSRFDSHCYHDFRFRHLCHLTSVLVQVECNEIESWLNRRPQNEWKDN